MGKLLPQMSERNLDLIDPDLSTLFVPASCHSRALYNQLLSTFPLFATHPRNAGLPRSLPLFRLLQQQPLQVLSRPCLLPSTAHRPDHRAR